MTATAGRVALVMMLALGAPAVTMHAQSPSQRGPQYNAPPQRGAQNGSPGWQSGYDRGVIAGQNQGRDGRQFNFSADPDYRRGDWGYRAQYGTVDRYRSDFRIGFESGYRWGYDQYGRGGGNNGRGRYDGRYDDRLRYDAAFDRGMRDGYDAGFNDGRRRNRFDPIAESRYRSGDHGYNRNYGTREQYRFVYRDAFRRGYDQGFRDGTRNLRNSQPWWTWFFQG